MLLSARIQQGLATFLCFVTRRAVIPNPYPALCEDPAHWGVIMCTWSSAFPHRSLQGVGSPRVARPMLCKVVCSHLTKVSVAGAALLRLGIIF